MRLLRSTLVTGAILVAVLLASAPPEASAEPKIFGPKAGAAAVGPSGKACTPVDFAAADCWVESQKTKTKTKAKKKRATKKKSSKKEKSTSSSSSSEPMAPSASASQSNGEFSGIAGSDANWLKTNGLQSPICTQSKNVADWGPDIQANCLRSGLTSLPAPTNNLGLDVHIDTGITKPGNIFASTVHNSIDFFWVQMVNVTATMFAGLEWAYSLDLLSAKHLNGIGTQLRALEAAWISPMMRIVMSFFGAWMLYIAIIRRQFRFALSEMAGSFAMTVAVLLVIANPVGTVGAVGKFSNDLGVYAITAVQSPVDSLSGKRPRGGASNGYSEALSKVFDAVVVRSWTLLEFGNVDWATSPKRFDPEMQKVAKGLAESWPKPVQQAVARADTNAELFLAFPPNSAERDGINDFNGKKTLLRFLCNNDNVEKCEGKYKAIADHRTQAGTYARGGQLFLVATGLICVWIMLGALVVGLLGASIAALFYLILIAVLLPMAWLNIGGAKRRFQHFAGELGGALIAKLIYSLALAVVVLVFNVILTLKLPFIVQWIMIIAAFFFLFRKRKELLGLAPGLVQPGRAGKRTLNYARRQQRRAAQKMRQPRTPREGQKRLNDLAQDAAAATRKRRAGNATPREGSTAPRSGASAATARPKSWYRVADDPAAEVVDTARKRVLGRGRVANGQLGELRERAGRLSYAESESTKKLAGLTPGTPEHKRETRRNHSLKRRAQEQDRRVSKARGDVERGKDVASRPANRGAELARSRRILEQQAMLPATSRDYRLLAGMGGVSPEEFDRLQGRERNQVRSAINRELRAQSTTTAARAGAGELVSTTSTAPLAQAAPVSAASLNRARVSGKRQRPQPRASTPR